MPEQTKKFYELTPEERLALLRMEAGLSTEEIAALSGSGGLEGSGADHMVENAIGVFSLPLGAARNFVVNGRAIAGVPMAVEEPSVVAAASFMAKLAAAGGGFMAESDPPVMIGQMQVLDLQNPQAAARVLLEHTVEILEEASAVDPVLKKLGGGAVELQARVINTSPIGAFLVVHIYIDVRDAMGANAVNTTMERLAPRVEELTGGRVLLRILSNLADRRLTRARCRIPLQELAFRGYSGAEVRDRVIEAWAFAASDPYRAATHNKGIMNGVDAVVVATGNDWRAVEAGAHAFAARGGTYTSLSEWSKAENGDLLGFVEMPMAVGIVGGATRVHPAARAVLRLMGVGTAAELAQIIVSVGLAQNLAALRALSTEGIQRGHMGLHARQVAIAAGAPPELVEKLAEELVKEKTVRIDRAQEILKIWRRA